MNKIFEAVWDSFPVGFFEKFTFKFKILYKKFQGKGKNHFVLYEYVCCPSGKGLTAILLYF